MAAVEVVDQMGSGQGHVAIHSKQLGDTATTTITITIPTTNTNTRTPRITHLFVIKSNNLLDREGLSVSVVKAIVDCIDLYTWHAFTFSPCKFANDKF